MKQFIDWFKDEDNLKNLETGSTIFFILLFVLYFYGFRTGFRPDLIRPEDVIIDSLIILVSSYLIIKDFAKRAVRDERLENNNIQEKEKSHEEKLNKIDRDNLPYALEAWNTKELKEKERKKRHKLLEYWKRRRRQYINIPNKKRSLKRKLRRIERKIEYYNHESASVKVKYKWIQEDDVYRKGATVDNDKDVGANYDPVKSTLSSQWGSVFGSIILFSFLRFVADPSLEQLTALVMFTLWLLAFLTFKASTSYVSTRFKTSNSYLLSVIKKIEIIDYVANYKRPIESEVKLKEGD